MAAAQCLAWRTTTAPAMLTRVPQVAWLWRIPPGFSTVVQSSAFFARGSALGAGTPWCAKRGFAHFARRRHADTGRVRCKRPDTA